MFDMGFTEMMLIGIVALIVIGPERLPGVARTAGKYLGRLKRFVSSVRADVEQELRADELREILAQQQRELDTLKTSINETGREIEKEVGDVESAGQGIASDLQDSVDSAAETTTATEPSAEPASAAASPAEESGTESAAEDAAESESDRKTASQARS